VSTKRPSKTDKYIGKRIRERREHLGLTQPELADRADVSYQQFQKYEIGQNRISAGRLYEIARALKIHVAYFFPGGEGSETGMRGVAEEGAEFEGPGQEPHSRPHKAASQTTKAAPSSQKKEPPAKPRRKRS
jgi:transcriptional regulator with XRE-family HTH domain